MTIELPDGLSEDRLVNAIAKTNEYVGENKDEFALEQISNVLKRYFKRTLLESDEEKYLGELIARKDEIEQNVIGADLNKMTVKL